MTTLRKGYYIFNPKSSYVFLGYDTTLSSSGSSSPITIGQDQNRTSGVAPLAVFFDATSTTCVGVDNPFHELAYIWDFGDTGSYMPDSTGPVASHVFDQPGTYTVTLTVIRVVPSLSLRMATWTITVDDPDVVFSGTNTVCIATDGDFTGAPAGCVQVTSSSVATAMGYMAAGTRILFKRGHTFTAAGSEVNAGSGPVIVGAFGTGTSPDERGIYTNNPIFSVTTNANQEGFSWRGTDIRVMDIEMVEGHVDAANYAAFNTWHRCIDSLIYRCKATGLRTQIGFNQDLIQYYGVSPHTNIFIAQCHFKDANSINVYVSGYRVAILGNYVDHSLTTHLIRVTFAEQCVIDGNLLEYPGATRQAIKLHAAQDRNNYNDYTEKVVIRRNEIRGLGTAWTITCGPEDSISDEWVRTVLLDGNVMYDDGGTQVGYYINSADTHLRNCTLIVQGIASSNTSFAFMGQRGIEPMPTGLAIYNNTCYTDSCGPGKATYFLETYNYSGVAIPCYNNAVYCQTGGTLSLTYPGDESKIDDYNNVFNTGLTFENAAAQDFRPAIDSSALGAGTTTFAYYDALGVVRAHADIGAYERASVESMFQWTDLTPHADTIIYYVSDTDGNDGNDGLSTGSALQTISAASSLLRSNKPDWLLLKRGDTFTDQRLGWFVNTLSGYSSTYPVVFGAYGNSGDARPMLDIGSSVGRGINLNQCHNVAITSIDFNCTNHVSGNDYDGITIYDSIGVLIEDCSFRDLKNGIQCDSLNAIRCSGISLRRCQIYDIYDTADGGLGVYFNETDGLLLEECFIDYCGWHYPTNPAGGFYHNTYINDTCGPVIIQNCISTRSSLEGLMVRPGGCVSGNFIAGCEIGIGYKTVNNFSGNPTIRSEVLHNIVTEPWPGHASLSWGIEFQATHFCLASGNIVHGNYTNYNSGSFSYALNDTDGQYGTQGCDNVTFKNNIAYHWHGPFSVYNWDNLSFNNTIDSNDIQEPYNEVDGFGSQVYLGTSFRNNYPASVVFSNNRYDSARATGAWFNDGLGGAYSLSEFKAISNDTTSTSGQVTYSDGGRSISGYMISIGTTGGLVEFCTNARDNRRYSWNDNYNAKSIINYMRSGFDLERI